MNPSVTNGREALRRAFLPPSATTAPMPGIETTDGPPAGAADHPGDALSPGEHAAAIFASAASSRSASCQASGRQPGIVREPVSR